MKHLQSFRSLALAGCVVMGLAFQSCSENDDNTDTRVEDFASFTVSDQTLSADNKLTIAQATFPEDGWIVIHPDNGSDAPDQSTNLNEPLLVSEAIATDIEVTLKDDVTIEDEQKLWVVLYKDDGTLGTFEYDGQSGLDMPYMNDDNQLLTASFIVNVDAEASGSFTAEDQDIEDNTLIVSSVTVDQNSWVVVHADNGEDGPVVPEIISEPVFLEAGTHNDVEVTLNNSANIKENDKLWIMLHADTGASAEYEFDGENGLDLPIEDAEGNIVTSSITALTVEAVASFEAADQVISQNTVVVSSASFNQDGWIVIHKDNGNGGPVVPEIVSEPTYVEAGTATDVEVQLDADYSFTDGETLWVMLHTDTGAEAVYEFDGNNGMDTPILDAEGNVVTSAVVISAASVTAADQAVTEGTVVIDEVVAAVDGWIVIHNEDGMGNITLPGIIGKAKVTAGVNTDVEIELDESVNITSGQKLFAMLHIEGENPDEYNFPGADIPEVFGFAVDNANVIVTEITVQ
ncbi:DUF7282 domain-containing protein [Zeaxanthinibacter enoshimensis]|uniref:DUF7282 domain-containing protein n=1 Tax=Zeaxanthinibacter enoshimensis TaxID=392009 RepID=A0A4R6TQR9_9FLAO|nr:hypothetical protein [Zeaxanthinibacter enoshimensis]TDQ32647.1 hypothetical protein CLV82_0480 [Zeaxanthinibacter enoshimensis]